MPDEILTLPEVAQLLKVAERPMPETRESAEMAPLNDLTCRNSAIFKFGLPHLACAIGELRQ
jgi:hypothetical protein